MESKPRREITVLLEEWSAGRPGAFDRLVEAAYPELHRIALNYFRRERAQHTLQCTALIHEAYLRLVDGPETQWTSRAHFFGFAARVMRSILVDYARAHRAAKRGDGLPALTLSESDMATTEPDVQILDLNTALDELAQIDPGQERIVELRYFGGLSIEETAAAMSLSASTVKREWVMAKTWIKRRLMAGEAGA